MCSPNSPNSTVFISPNSLKMLGELGELAEVHCSPNSPKLLGELGEEKATELGELGELSEPLTIVTSNILE